MCESYCIRYFAEHSGQSAAIIEFVTHGEILGNNRIDFVLSYMDMPKLANSIASERLEQLGPLTPCLTAISLRILQC